MQHSPRSLRRLVGVLGALVMLAAACSSSPDESVADAADEPVEAAQPTPTSPPVITLPTATPEPEPPSEEDESERRILAGVNVAIFDVPLDEIVFDTFDGGSVTLAEAEEQQILGLLNAIPPIDEPVYIDGATEAWLTPDDLILGYLGDDGSAWAHPHRVLNFHEIINTTVAERPIVVTYCPLCGSGVIFDRRPNDLRHDGVLTFDNTSALYENDMVMVDPETHTYWWQVAGQGLVGNLTGTRLTTLPSTTTTWGAWLDLHPDTKVLSNDQGRGPGYERDPFADYATSVDRGRVPFPVGPEAFADERLSPGTRIIGIDPVGEPAAVPVLTNEPTVVVVGDRDVVVFLDGRGGGAAFEATVDGAPRTFEATAEGFIDAETQSTWTAGGRAVEGPATGEQLTQLPSTTAFWFAWVSSTQGRETDLYLP